MVDYYIIIGCSGGSKRAHRYTHCFRITRFSRQNVTPIYIYILSIYLQITSLSLYRKLQTRYSRCLIFCLFERILRYRRISEYKHPQRPMIESHKLWWKVPIRCRVKYTSYTRYWTPSRELTTWSWKYVLKIFSSINIIQLIAVRYAKMQSQLIIKMNTTGTLKTVTIVLGDWLLYDVCVFFYKNLKTNIIYDTSRNKKNKISCCRNWNKQTNRGPCETLVIRAKTTWRRPHTAWRYFSSVIYINVFW